ncbi:hypothetical protein JW930_02085 [Candidatus Woesearchaeota archaeon]|nr:hypothetical protein [Candidatus Woesearchaeota archaeon]
MREGIVSPTPEPGQEATLGDLLDAISSAYRDNFLDTLASVSNTPMFYLIAGTDAQGEPVPVPQQLTESLEAALQSRGLVGNIPIPQGVCAFPYQSTVERTRVGSDTIDSGPKTIEYI